MFCFQASLFRRPRFGVLPSACLLFGCFVASGCTGEVIQEGDLDDLEPVAKAKQSVTRSVVAQGDVVATLGQGYNSITEEFRSDCIKGGTTWVPNSEASVTFKQSTSTSKMNSQLGIGASAKASYGLFSGSARANFARSAQSTSRSTSVLYSYRATLGTEVLSTSGWMKWNVSRKAPDFLTRCGDFVVKETTKGGEIFILMKLDFASEADKQAFDLSFSGSYATAEVSADLKLLRESFKSRVSISLSAYQKGGDVERLGNAISGESNAYAVTHCSLTNMKACEQFLSDAINYATGTGKYAFPQTLKKNPADLKYKLQDWSVLGQDVPVAAVPPDMQTGRDWLLTRYKEQIELQNRIDALQESSYFGGPTPFRETVDAFQDQVNSNLQLLEKTYQYCFDKAANPPTEGDASICYFWASLGFLKFAGYVELDISELDVPLGVQKKFGRKDYVTQVTPYQGNWGTWRDWEVCPAGTFAMGYRQRVEANQGGGDDTGLNAVELICGPWDHSKEVARVDSYPGAYGTWSPDANCTRGVINGMNLFYEGNQGSSKDDTAANKVEAECTSGELVKAAGGTGWGTPMGMTRCPAGSAVCGIRSQFEAAANNQDDTAMNGVALACCAY